MIFINVDPRYACRLDDKQSSDTIVTMERVRKAISFNAELADESISRVSVADGLLHQKKWIDIWYHAPGVCLLQNKRIFTQLVKLQMLMQQ